MRSDDQHCFEVVGVHQPAADGRTDDRNHTEERLRHTVYTRAIVLLRVLRDEGVEAGSDQGARTGTHHAGEQHHSPRLRQDEDDLRDSAEDTADGNGAQAGRASRRSNRRGSAAAAA